MTPNKDVQINTHRGALSSGWVKVETADEREPSILHAGDADGEESSFDRQKQPRPFQYPGKAKVDRWKAMVNSKEQV